MLLLHVSVHRRAQCASDTHGAFMLLLLPLLLHVSVQRRA
jgi:hypothetical protein